MKEITFKTITLNWIKIIRGNTNTPQEAGVYQIYGDSPTYGTNTLLYIGKADNLYHRIHLGHLANEESHIMRQPNISIRYATTHISLNHIAEEILIVMHKPSFNAMSIGNINSKSKEFPIYIQNFGERGMLNLEVTNIHFIN
jgi:excinuclease UvrABC nuclease subunit